MDLELDGKRALVLASSKGLGRASAQELAREGARVAISSRSEENLATAKNQIVEEAGANPDDVIPVVCDLSNPDSVTESVEEAIDRLGGLDVLVTNSSGPEKIGFETATIEDFDAAYDRILKSIVVAIEAALPTLIEHDGAITNLIAASTQEPPADHVVGNTIRAGIYGLAKSLSREYAGDNVRVNCVCPRKVGTATNDRQPIEAEIPLGRRGELADFGKAVAFISSDVAKHVTGQNLNVDGGWTKHAF